MDLLDRLIGVVETLLEEHRALLEEGRRQQQALIAGDIKALEEAVGRMDERVKRIAEREWVRQEIGLQLAARLGIPPEEVRLPVLAGRTGPEAARKMRELAEAFDRVMEELRRVNEQNRALTEQSLFYVRQMIDVLTDAQAPGVYGPARPAGPTAGAPAGPAGGARMFDARA